MRRWQRSLLASTAILALSASTWATCAEGSMSPEMQQMACCKNGNHSCGPKGSPADCCKKNGSTQPDTLTVAKVHRAEAPVLTMVAWTIWQDLSWGALHYQPAYDSSPPRASLRPPPYIVFSALLI